MKPPLPRNEFAVTQRSAYLNHAWNGVLPRSSADAIEKYCEEHARAGSGGTFPYDLRMPEYRERIGRFIGVAGTEIAILQNTSYGAGAIAAGLDWNPGDDVLLCDNEFPANAIAWVALRERGVNVRRLATGAQRLTPERLQREITSRTRVVAVSWVSYIDGYRHDLEGLATVTHDAGALICVDAIQALGVLPLDAAALRLDAVYAGAQKWLLGLHGAAILYVAPALNDRLKLVVPGWRSVENIWDDFLAYDRPFTNEAMRFEAGSANLIGTLALVSAIDLLTRAGVNAIADHVLALTDRLCAGLGDVGAEIAAPRGRDVSSGIVTFRVPGHDSLELGRTLEEEGIVTTYRSGGIRVSPHGYNTAEEIDVLLESLARRVRARVFA